MSAAGFPTPDVAHLKRHDFEHVYEPAEDTFLMLDALEHDLTTLQAAVAASSKPLVCLEIGAGSGMVITFLAQLLGPSHTFLATDINPHAVDAARQTAEKNGVNVTVTLSNLADEIFLSVAGTVDILLFNPPYVVTESHEVGSCGIAAAWAGGKDGREVLDRLLPQLPVLLSPTGMFYLLALHENIKAGAHDNLMTGVAGVGPATVLLQRRAGPERLSVLRYTR